MCTFSAWSGEKGLVSVTAIAWLNTSCGTPCRAPELAFKNTALASLCRLVAAATCSTQIAGTSMTCAQLGWMVQRIAMPYQPWMLQHVHLRPTEELWHQNIISTRHRGPVCAPSFVKRRIGMLANQQCKRLIRCGGVGFARPIAGQGEKNRVKGRFL